MKIYTDDEMMDLISRGIVDIFQIDSDDEEEWTEQDYPYEGICQTCEVRFVHDFPTCIEHCPYR